MFVDISYEKESAYVYMYSVATITTMDDIKIICL